MMRLKDLLKHLSTRVYLLLLVIVTWIVYFPSLTNKFVWDDIDFILRWKAIRTFNVLSFFQGVLPDGHEGVYRPLRTVAYAISYRMFATDSFWYHAESLLFHTIAVILVFALARSIVKNRHVAFAVASMYALHPLHTESVAFVVAGFDTLGHIFFFSSIYVFFRALRDDSKKLYALSLLLTCLGYFSGESTLTLPLVVTLIFFTFGTRRRDRGAFVQFVVPFYVLLFAYAIIRFFILHVPLREGGFEYPASMLWVLMLRVVTLYSSLIVLPLGLSVTHKVVDEVGLAPAAGVPMWVQYFNLQAFIGICIIIFIFFLIFTSRKKNSILFFGLSWSVITFLPYSNIVPLGSTVAERYLYVPLFGVILALTGVLTHVVARVKARVGEARTFALLGGALAVILSVYGVRSNIRVHDWHDGFTLWEKTVSVSPKSSLAHQNLGVEYYLKEQYIEAQKSFEKSLALNPAPWSIYDNLGQVFLAVGEDASAEAYFQKAIAIDPNRAKPYNGLAIANARMGDVDEAETILKNTIEKHPNEETYNRLAMLYVTKNEFDKALPVFEEAAVTFNSALMYSNAGALYINQKKWKEAINSYLAAERLGMHTKGVYLSLSQAYSALGDNEKAQFYKELSTHSNE